MKVIILAGGKATRLPKSAKNIPKPLVKVAGKPILQHQIDLLQKHGLTDIRLSLGYKAKQIIRYFQQKDFKHYPLAFLAPPSEKNKKLITRSKTMLKTLKTYPRAKISIEYIIEPKPFGTGGAIKFASKDLKEDFMVLNGDILTDINLSEFISKYQYNENVSRETFGAISLFYCENASDYGLVDVEKGRIVKFVEKPFTSPLSINKMRGERKQQRCSGYINAGFYILSPKIFENVSRETFSIERDIFPELSKKRHLMAYIHQGFWTDLGTEKRLWEARRKFLKKM